MKINNIRVDKIDMEYLQKFLELGGLKMINGTVTISLEDYLQAMEEKKHYIELANQHIKLLEKIEETLQVEGIRIDLSKEITGSLDNWYNQDV